MAIEVVVPRLGWSMDEGVFVEWLKQDGDLIDEGDVLFALESEKAIQEVESIDAGILRIPPDGPADGDTLAVGTVLAWLLEADERAPFEVETSTSAAMSQETPEPPPPVGVTPPAEPPKVAAMMTAATVPKRQRLAARGLPRISPRAAGTAARLGIDWTKLNGTGKNGRIRDADVYAAGASATVATSTSADSAPCVTHPVTAVRRTIAGRMLASQASTAAATLTATADATNLAALRDQFRAVAKSSNDVIPSYTDLIAVLTVGALGQHPQLNSRMEDDRIIVPDQCNLGIAVDTQAGLLVPVLHDAGSLGLKQLAERSRKLIERARRRELSANDLQGGTFTISNLGAFGIDAFTPIINHPECAILGIGRISKQPAVINDQIMPRDMLTLSLTFDHRVVDGTPAARFLQTLGQLIENPGPWLVT